MRIIRDCDDDLWIEFEPDKFRCRASEDWGDAIRSFEWIKFNYSPIEVYRRVEAGKL